MNHHTQPLRGAAGLVARRHLGISLTAALLCLPSSGWGQINRDPTLPPEAARAQPPQSGSSAAGVVEAPAGPLSALQHRMVVNGKPYLVERGWLRGVGDLLGTARIERITDVAVWLREDGVVRKLPLYPQVQIMPRAVAPASSETPAP